MSRAAIRAVWQSQDDPELERLRLDVWRGYGFVALWMFGFPLLVSGVLVSLFLILWHPPR